MILELDCGNSFIKWRVISVDGTQRLLAGVVDSDAAALIDTLVPPSGAAGPAPTGEGVEP